MENTVKAKLYEGMFLVDSARAAADWDGVISTIRNILERNEAEIVSLRKWDERKLAYEIDGKTRGTYILCYFRANGRRIRAIERDVQLSERIMRVLVLRAEHMKEVRQMQNDAFGEGASPVKKSGKEPGPKDEDPVRSQHLTSDNGEDIEREQATAAQEPAQQETRGS